MTQPPSPDWITSAEVAALLHCSQRTVGRMTERGELTAAYTYPGPRGARLYDPAPVLALALARARGDRTAQLDLDLPTEGNQAP